MADRGYGRHGGDLPLIPLSDGAGHVVETGTGVTRCRAGDLVCPAFSQSWIGGPLREHHRGGMLGGTLPGVMREFGLFPETGLVKAPRGWTALQAATLPCAALTAWNAVICNGTKPGDAVVTQGTGGVALFAMQFAMIAGARTIVTSSSDAKLERIKAMGADVTINYRAEPKWSAAVREALSGVGADLVVDIGGAGSLGEAVRATRVSGTIVLIGVMGGGTATARIGPRRHAGDQARQRHLRQSRYVRGHGPRHRPARTDAGDRRPCLCLRRTCAGDEGDEGSAAFRQDLPGFRRGTMIALRDISLEHYADAFEANTDIGFDVLSGPYGSRATAL